MKKLTLTLTFVLLCSNLTACGAKLLGADYPGSTPTDVIFERDYQRIITYDCNHNVISNSVETVKSPTYYIEMPSKFPSQVARSEFKNQTNGAIPGVTVGYFNFTLDYSYGFLNMHVEPGINVIEYKYYSCDQWGTGSDGGPVCLVSNTLLESGTSTINALYVEKTLPDTEESNCVQPSPTPTPTPAKQ